MSWKLNEINFLKENYKQLSIKEISNKLNKTEKAVRAKLERLDLSLRVLKRTEVFKWSNEQLQFLIDNYKIYTDREISEKLFNDNSLQGSARVYRKRHSLHLEKDERGLEYKDNNCTYKSRFYNGEKIFEHRENAEIKLGKKLNEFEIVHHIDGDKKNNNLENLYVCRDNKEHKILHYNLEKIAMDLVKKGIIKFDEENARYYTNF